MKLNRILSLALALLLLGAGIAQAHSAVYEDDGGPLFTLSVPAGWTFRADGTRLVAAPADNSMWFGTWKLKKQATPQDATLALQTYLEAHFQDVKLSETSQAPINGMSARRFQGTGTFNGNPVRYAVVIFESKAGTKCAAVGVWNDETREREGPIEAILGSLRPLPAATAGR